MNKSLILFGVVILSSLSLYSVNNAYAIPITYYDYTSIVTTNAQPFGIECSANDFVYMTTFVGGDGGILKIDKTNPNTATFISESTGSDWFSIESDNNGNLFINERDNGLAWKYVESSGTLSKFAVVQQIQSVAGATVTYPSGFNNQPDTINIDLTSNGVGVDYNLNMNLGGHAGEVQLAKGFIWVSVNYSIDFPADVNTAGLSDITFYGLAKINPATGAVVNHINLASEGATDVRGLTTDGNFIWVTSQANNKILKFDTVSETVVENITLSSGSNPRGITTNTNYVFVALNKASGGNSEVLRIDKSTLAQTVIDTGAVNDNRGTFTVFTSGDVVLWTDESGNTGNFLSSGGLPTFTATETSENHYGCQVDNNFWFAGKGSVKSGVTPIPSGNNGGGDSWQSKPTFGISYLTNDQIVTDGFGYGVLNNIKTKTITDNFHTDFEMVEIPTGTPYTFFAKGYFANDPWIQEFCFGIPEAGKGYLAESCVEVYYDGKRGNEREITDVNLVQKSQVISNVTAIHTMASCQGNGEKGICDKTIITVTFQEPLKDKVMMIKGIDHKRKTTETYLNNGFDINGKQFTSLPDNVIPSPVKYAGLIKVTQSEKYSNLWISDDGKIFERNSSGSFVWINQSFQRHQDNEDMRDRSHSEFSGWKQTQAINAKSVFDSEKIQAVLPDSFAYDFSNVDSRTQFLIDHNLLEFVRK